MKAFILQKPFCCNFINIDQLIPAEHEAVLKLVRNGICGSDLNSYRGKNAYLSFPRIPGHEIAAEIISVPKNDKGLVKGMLVTCNPYFNCGHCYSCSRGFVNCCQHNQTMGVQRDGGMQEIITMPVERIIDGKGLHPDLIALIEPCAIAYHGIKKAHIKKGNTVLVIGTGTIGMCASLAAKELGATVYVSDISEKKLAFATNNFEIDGVILNDSSYHFIEQVMQYTCGEGFDIVVEAVGNPATFQASIDATAYCGTIIQIGISDRNLDFNFTMIQKKELRIFGSRNALSGDFEEVVSLFMKRTDWQLSSLISARFPFSETPKAFSFLDANASSVFKVMIEH